MSKRKPKIFLSYAHEDIGKAKRIYQDLKDGMTKVEALRQAKLKLIQSNGEFGGGPKFSFAHPFLWAAFIIVGQGY